eukprot:PLAT9822.1.p2 GENE.PLAT9822.1~~PLAT9822.1.p2  ORF type:complete len:331 (+),score=178.94 PLAT9822.1:44-994(+)
MTQLRALLAVTLLAVAASAEPLTFLSLGDWGKVDTDQGEVATAMNSWATKLDAQFVLALGDNFYEYGVHNVWDPQFKTTWEDVYTGAVGELPWHVIMGNHDHYGNASAELDYSHRNPRWHAPDFNYSITVPVGNSSTLQIIAIDTIIMGGNSFQAGLNELAESEDCTLPEHRVRQLREWQPQSQAASMLQWLEETLAASSADWRIVMGHFPVYSAGEHGNTFELQEQVKPLLEKYGVDAYLCGHDHTLQHLESESVQYFVSGGGAKLGEVHPIAQSKFAVVKDGFMAHSIDGKEMTTHIVGTDGSVLYSFTQKARN